VEEDRVAGLDIEGADGVEADHVAALEGCDVDEPGPGDDLRDGLGGVLLLELHRAQAAEAAVALAQVAQSVEVRSELGRGREHLPRPVDAVLS